jgi:O-antigen/teichoic acid export membrane protein
LYVGKINGPQLLFAEKTWLISGLSLVTVSLNIVASYFLVLSYGAIGAAIGTVISTLLSTFLGFYYAQKHAHINWDGKVITLCYSYVFVSATYVLFIDVGVAAFDIFIKLFIICSFIYISSILGVFKISDSRKKLYDYIKGDRL